MSDLLPLLTGLAAAAVVLLWMRPPSPPDLADEPPGLAPGSRRGPADGAPGWGDVQESAPPRRSVREALRELAGRVGVGRTEMARDRELQVLDGLAAALEAGLPVPQAVALAVSQVSQAPERHDPSAATGWDELARAASQGQALAPVWQRMARRSGSPTLSAVARAWRVAALTGAPLARAIRVSAHASRERRRLERAVQVATAGARATVSVLTLLPLAGVGLAAVLGVSPVSLYGHPLALASATAGAVLVLTGQLWSRRMVHRVLRGTT